jgi:hypothetical protein
MAEHHTYEHITNLFDRDEALAEDPGTPPRILDKIARKRVVPGWASDRGTKNIGWAREKVAANPSTTAATLEWLSAVENDWVMLSAVLRHPNTQLHILREHAARPDGLREQLIQNPAAPDEFILDVVAAHPTPGVIAGALSNPRLTDAGFERIVEMVGPSWSSLVAAQRAARAARPA